MEVGSLVECIKWCEGPGDGIKVGTRWTVRWIRPCGCGQHTDIAFEELAPWHHWLFYDQELGYDITHFRELLPPTDIAAMLEETEEEKRDRELVEVQEEELETAD